VLENQENLDRMLGLSDGRRRVPVIVDGDQIMIGFNGRS
jgi:glutaredoxin